MATATKTLGELSTSELKDLLNLVGGSDSIELKATLPASEHRGTIAALGIDPLEAQIRQIYFFDTPDLQLSQAGVVVRARRVAGRSGDTVIKLRPIHPAELPEDLRRLSTVNVEVDAMPGGYVCSATMKEKVSNALVREVATGGRPLRKLLSKEQRAFFAAHAPDGVELDDLARLGPVFVLKLALNPEELGRRLVVELWLLPDGSRILELSTKCVPGEGFRVAVETRAYLEGLGLNVVADPHTKTKTTLEFFASELREQTG